MMTLAREVGDNRNRRWPLVWGGALVAVGVLSFGDRIGWWPGLNWTHLWPIVMIVTGSLLVLPPWDRAPGVGFWLLIEGVLFLLNAYGVLSLKTSWPLLIVGVGVWIVMVAAAGRSRRDRRHAR